MSKMPSKKKNAKSAPSSKKVVHVYPGDGSVKLDETTRLRLNWIDAEKRAAENEALSKQLFIDDFLRKFDPGNLVKKTFTEITNARENVKKRELEYIATCKEVAEKLNIDPSREWPYDDESGIIHLVSLMTEDEEKNLPPTLNPSKDKKPL